MLKFPDVPTDSMYKFKSIAFFIIAIGFMVLAGITFMEDDSVIETKAKVAVNSNHERISEIDSALAEVDSMIVAIYTIPDTTSPSNLFTFQENLYNWRLELMKERHKLNMDFWYYSQVWNKSADDFDLKSLESLLYLIFSLLFIVATNESFKEWKLHLQRYNDAILMKEAGVSDEKIQEHLKAAEEDKKERDKQNIFQRLFSKKKKISPKKFK